jgi:lysophospholipase L1-like esterase
LAYYNPARESARQHTNDWIRGGGAWDAVVDIDQVLRDPAQPTRLNPVYDSGDHLHPNDAGYQAMAQAVPLGLFAAV